MSEADLGLQQRSGEGTYTYSQHGTEEVKDTYKGSWEKNNKHGIGKQIYTGVGSYYGNWENGKRHGEGVMIYTSEEQAGDIYYGQIQQFERHGLGKHIFFDGSYFEGTWVQDKMHGEKCKLFDAQTKEVYVGNFENNKKMGVGRHYDHENEEIFEGEFSNDKREGMGTLYKRDGRVYKAFYRNNYMENQADLVGRLSEGEVEAKFEEIQVQNDVYHSVYKQPFRNFKYVSMKQKAFSFVKRKKLVKRINTDIFSLQSIGSEPETEIEDD